MHIMKIPKIMVSDINNENSKINILLIHAQDHLMNCITFFDMAKEIVDLYERIEK